MPIITKASSQSKTSGYTFVIENFNTEWEIGSVKVTPSNATYTINRTGSKLTITVKGGNPTGQGDNGGRDSTYDYAEMFGGTCPSVHPSPPSNRGTYTYTGSEIGNSGKVMCNYSAYLQPSEYWNLYSYTVEASYTTAQVNGKVSQQQKGAYLKLGTEEYILLDPATGFMVRSTPLTDTRAYASSTGVYFDPANTGSVAYYLNTTYLNSLSAENQQIIRNTPWGTGTVSNVEAGLSTNRPTITPEAIRDKELTRLTDARIGMLSVSQWRANSTFSSHAGSAGVLQPTAGIEWLITPTSSSVTLSIAQTGALTTNTMATALRIRPALYVDPNTSIINNVLVANNQPVVTTVSPPSGAYEEKPSFSYTVNDADGHAMTVTESIDGKILKTHTDVSSDTSLTFDVSDLEWISTRINEEINIDIKVDDGNGGEATASYPITRTVPAIDMQLKEPFETDAAARRLLLTLNGSIPADAVISVQACNNAFDASPTWENATNMVLSNLPYPFMNETKTSDRWGISFKVKIEREESTRPIFIDGVSGAFD